MCPWESQFQNNFNLVWFGRKQVDFWKGGIRGSLNITKYATQDIFWLWRCQLSASKSFPYSFSIFSVFQGLTKIETVQKLQTIPHQSESGPNQFAKYVQHNSIQCSRDFMFYVHIPKEERASINTQYVLIFLVPRSGAPTCWCWIMGWGWCIIILRRRWLAVCATNRIFSAYRQDTVARPAWATLKRKTFITPM